MQAYSIRDKRTVISISIWSENLEIQTNFEVIEALNFLMHFNVTMEMTTQFVQTFSLNFQYSHTPEQDRKIKMKAKIAVMAFQMFSWLTIVQHLKVKILMKKIIWAHVNDIISTLSATKRQGEVHLQDYEC